MVACTVVYKAKPGYSYMFNKFIQFITFLPEDLFSTLLCYVSDSCSKDDTVMQGCHSFYSLCMR